MDPCGRLSVCGDCRCYSFAAAILKAEDMAEVLQIKVFEKHRKSGKSVLYGLHCNSCVALPG